MRFDGRVVVITGAGRGIGRAYALLLASRGASVIVNDLGGSMEGIGSDAGPASDVVSEIVATGGTALVDANDVSTVDGGQAIIDAAIDAYGRIDALINNAGIMRWSKVPDVTAEDLQAHLDVHVHGSFNTTRAAWPHMVEAGYGRVVMTTSAGMLGHPANLAYATAKGAVVGMMRSLATAGGNHGIKVNAIAPAAATRLGGDEGDPAMSPEFVAPMAAYLAHEDCPVTGEIYAAGANRFARMFLASATGYAHDRPKPAPEDVAANWAVVNDEENCLLPTDLTDWSTMFLGHLR